MYDACDTNAICGWREQLRYTTDRQADFRNHEKNKTFLH